MFGESQYPTRFTRLPIKIQIDYSTIDIFLESEIMNLSKGGVFIQADIPLSTGSLVDFEFTLPKTNRLVKAHGVVVWTRTTTKQNKTTFPQHSSGMGIQFVDLDPDDIDAILDEMELIVQDSNIFQ